MAKDCKLLLGRKYILFFSYCVISDVFTVQMFFGSLGLMTGIISGK